LRTLERKLRKILPEIRLVEPVLGVYQDALSKDALIKEEAKKGYYVGGLPRLSALALYSMVRNRKCDLVLETGVASGLSSYFVLKAMKENGGGNLMSIDLPNYENAEGYVNADGRLDNVYTPREKGVGWIVPDELRSNWKLILGSSEECLPKVGEVPDIFYHDSEHSYKVMKMEYEWAYAKGVKLIMSDDIEWSKAWPDFVHEHGLEHVEHRNLGICLA
jgi:hypothetical protein